MPSRSPTSTSRLRLVAAGLTLVLLSLTAAGCSGCSDPAPGATGGPAGSAPVTSAMPVASSDLLHNKLRTTDPKIALANLDSQISETQRAFDQQRDDADLRKKAVGLLLERAGITGSAKDRARALEIADDFLKGHADVDAAHLLRARALAAHHRFAEALAELEQADKLAKIPGGSVDLRQSVLAGQGRYDEVYPTYRATADKYPSPTTLLDLATVAARMGKLDEAEKAFVDAEERFRGATPFLIANLYFERGSMFERAGDLAKATILYRAAHARLPQHVHAAVHLAALVSPSEGISILEPLAGGEADPDLLAQLGVLKNLVQAKSGDDALARATARYDALMAEQPLAYADHAGWYWLVSAGEPKKALDAAKLNLSSRKTAEAYELAISAAQAGGPKEELCAFVNEARALRYRSAKLEEIIRPLDCPAAP
jgi:hypothetical protein